MPPPVTPPPGIRPTTAAVQDGDGESLPQPLDTPFDTSPLLNR